MKVLILGSGAKDSAIAWWFSKSRKIENLFIAPGNPGTSAFATNLPDIDLQDKEQILNACKKYDINYVFIGTETPLVAGIPDFLIKNGLSVFGTPSYALKFEDDKKFSREFAKKYNIPMPDYHVFDNLLELEAFLDTNKNKFFVLKPNNISPSKIIVISDNKATLLEATKKHLKSSSVIVEDFIKGISITLTLLLDKKGYLILPICSEYTKKEHGKEDIITGGMGAVCPVPLDDKIKQKIRNEIIKPTLKGMQENNLFYKGVLTFSIILKDDQPYLVDYHVRLNDPATESFVPLINNDLVDIVNAIEENKLSSIKLDTTNDSTVAVVLAAEGYPTNTKTKCKVKLAHPKYNTSHITGFPYIFYGAINTINNKDNKIVNTGGRIATVVGISTNIIKANYNAYSAIGSVELEGGIWYREDIGNKFFISMAE